MEKRILNIAIGMVTGLIILSSCAVQKQETKAIPKTPPKPILISGTVVSDTGETISEAKILAKWRVGGEWVFKEVFTAADGRFAFQTPRGPNEIEASKPGYFSSTIKPYAETILSDLRFVLKSGGGINVKIIRIG